MTPARLWVADVGNTHIHYGLARASRILSRRPVPTAQIARRLPRARGACAAASVRPSADAALRRRWPTVRFLGRDFPAAIDLRGPSAREVGADRLANAAAAWARCRRACVAVDVGTAVNFDVVSPRGRFLGGVIAAGMGMASEALHRWCALLPRVSPGRARRAIAATTESNIRAGLYWGMRGALIETLRRIRRELGRRPRVFGTGSDGALFKDLFDAYVPALTLEGVAVSYRAWPNHSSSAR